MLTNVLKCVSRHSHSLGDIDSPSRDEEPHSSRTSSNENLQQTSSKYSSPQSIGLIRVKRNLFDRSGKELAASKETETAGEASNSLVYNKKAMDIYVQPVAKDSEVDGSSRSSTPLLIEHDQEFENIVCSPTLIHHYLTENIKRTSSQSDLTSPDKAENMEEYDDDDDDDLFIEEANVCSNDVLYNMITQKFENCESFSNSMDTDSELKRKLLISSVGSLNHQYQDNADGGDQLNDMKQAIGGLYLRNPRGKSRPIANECIKIKCLTTPRLGNQVRQYDVNALYSALQDVKNGHSIYRFVQQFRCYIKIRKVDEPKKGVVKVFNHSQIYCLLNHVE